MAKARIFISSTCYDLSAVREELDTFLSSLGFEVLNSEKSSFGVKPGVHSHTACIEQVKLADYLLLLIGKRRGGTHIGTEKSITNEEFNAALKLGIPVIACVDSHVLSHLPTYKKNPTGDFSDVVDDKRVFHFIEYINAGATDNWLHKYTNISDVKKIIKSQISYYLSLYSNSLKPEKNKAKSKNKDKFGIAKFPSSIKDFPKLDQEEQTTLKNGLKSLHNIISKIVGSSIKDDNKLEQLKCLWVIAKHGELEEGYFKIDHDTFKQFAWSSTRGKRVFNQMKSFGVNGDYDYDDAECYIHLSFNAESDDSSPSWALQKYVSALSKRHDEDDAIKIFQQANMQVFSP